MDYKNHNCAEQRRMRTELVASSNKHITLTGRTEEAIKIESLKLKNKSCASCTHFRNINTSKTVCLLKSMKPVKSYNICHLHEICFVVKPKDKEAIK